MNENGISPLAPRLRLTAVHSVCRAETEAGFCDPGGALSMWELTYVERGCLHCVAGGADQLVRQGELVLYAPEQWHMRYADIGAAPVLLTIRFSAGGCDLSGLDCRKFALSPQAAALPGRILRETETRDDCAGDMVFSLLSLLLLTLKREAAGSKLPAVRPSHSENAIIRHAQQYVGVHVREKLSVPLVARKVDVSPSYLTALFHKHLQISPGEYIRRVKLEESKRMIRENTMNFTEIAAALQYSTVHHFSRQFKDKFGVTPTEYARSAR